jgi:hypothetical protein
VSRPFVLLLLAAKEAHQLVGRAVVRYSGILMALGSKLIKACAAAAGCGPSPDIGHVERFVRDVPQAAIGRCSLDHLVGASKQRGRYGQVQRLRRLEIDYELNFHCLLDWQIVRSRACENPTYVDTG